MQLILNKDKNIQTMILTNKDNKKVFVKNKQNSDSVEAELFDNIVDLINNYFEDGKL